jgi:hypothetical protein
MDTRVSNFTHEGRMKRSLVLPQDYGTITILWSQPVAGLQILSPDGKWRWIRHIDNAIVGVHHVLSLDAWHKGVTGYQLG